MNLCEHSQERTLMMQSKKMQSNLYKHRIDTPLGPFVASWTDSGLWAFEFFRDEEGNNFTHGNGSRWLGGEPLELAVQDYFRNGHLDWNLDDLDWQGVSPFHQRVLRACSQIPTGSVLTYGKLAEEVGSPQAARAVGGAMAKNRWPLIIPCHRVVGACGRLTGYSGRGGVETKRQLLDWESLFQPTVA
jgi:methylated-DNA-[protein]-cysteine S-methyltransferase